MRMGSLRSLIGVITVLALLTVCCSPAPSRQSLKDALVSAKGSGSFRIIDEYCLKNRVSKRDFIEVFSGVPHLISEKYFDECNYFIRHCGQPEMMEWHFEYLSGVVTPQNVQSTSFWSLLKWPTHLLLEKCLNPPESSQNEVLIFYVMCWLKKTSDATLDSGEKMSEIDALGCTEWMADRLNSKALWVPDGSRGSDVSPYIGKRMVYGLGHFRETAPKVLSTRVGKSEEYDAQVVKVMRLILTNESTELLRTLNRSKFADVARDAKITLVKRGALKP